MDDRVILRVGAKILIPFILIFVVMWFLCMKNQKQRS